MLFGHVGPNYCMKFYVILCKRFASTSNFAGSHAVHRLWCQNVGDAPGGFPVLKIYDGAYHQLLNEPNRDEVISDIIAFVLSAI